MYAAWLLQARVWSCMPQVRCCQRVAEHALPVGCRHPELESREYHGPLVNVCPEQPAGEQLLWSCIKAVHQLLCTLELSTRSSLSGILLYTASSVRSC